MPPVVCRRRHSYGLARARPASRTRDPPSYVAEQLDAARRWGMGRMFADFAYGDSRGFDYAPVRRGDARGQPSRRCRRQPSDGRCRPEGCATTDPLQINGTAHDNYAVRFVRWRTGDGASGVAELTWDPGPGDPTNGWKAWKTTWTAKRRAASQRLQYPDADGRGHQRAADGEDREGRPLTMRVLHVQRAKGVSGSERHLLSLLPALGAVGVETRMCVLSTGDGPRFVDELSASGIDVTMRNAGGNLNAKLVPELMAEIRAFRPDIVHTHLFHADLVGQVAADEPRAGDLVGALDRRLLPTRAVSERRRALSRLDPTPHRDLGTRRPLPPRSPAGALRSASGSSTTASMPTGGRERHQRAASRGRHSTSPRETSSSESPRG